MDINAVQQNTQMTTVLPVKGVILDMDGTLIESTEADYLAWKWLFAHYNKPFTFQQYMPLLGIKSADVIKTQLQLHGEALNIALKKKMDYFKEVVTNNGIRTVPFAEALLQNLKKYPVQIALATSSRRDKMKLLMEKFGFLRYFDVLVTGEEVQNSKPAPDIFSKAAHEMGLTPDMCIVIEDAANGVTAAKRAHMKCVAITTTHTADLLQHADLIIDSFENADLKEWCSKL